MQDRRRPHHRAMEGVIDLPMEPGEARKAGLLLAATELYVARQGHDASERRIFAELFRQLLPETPPEHRLTIARLLAAAPETPPECLSLLAADPDSGIAAAALAGETALPETDLIARAASGDAAVHRAIAARSQMPATVAGVLLRHADAPTLKVLLARPDCPPDERVLELLSAREDMLRALAADLARRHALPAQLLFALFLDLDSAGRMEAIAAAEARALAELARRGDPKLLNVAFKPAVLEALVEAALSGGLAVFAARLAHALALPAETAARIVDDPGGEALVLALRALGTGDSESGRILVRVLGQSAALEHLRGLVALHDRVTPRAAMLVMEGLHAGPASAVEQLVSAREEAPRAALARARGAGLVSPYGGVSHAERRDAQAGRASTPSTTPAAAPSRRDAG
ncbi:DUF2336 domain-containing protein [Stappia indica]|uniref:DUF2336 domain-containing protein n=1 Tax=Stappia indica TaxID=538381 RepID=UPI001D181C22|nr:DUF2336 domain-containing protein [Stappia indica]MCC4246208.1 DUF2336 domain-containing protein [Stappia indica]